LKESPRQRESDCKEGEPGVFALELPLLVSAAGLDRSEEFLDDPASAVAVDNGEYLFSSARGFRGEKKPLDGFRSFRCVHFIDMHDMDLDLGRVALVEVRRSLEL
jgi:hypothetical protein